jgi:hypothetical protein
LGCDERLFEILSLFVFGLLSNGCSHWREGDLIVGGLGFRSFF